MTFLEEAQKIGINKVFLIDPKSPSRNTAIKIWEHIGEYPRLTFDCSGSQLTNQIAVDVSCRFYNSFQYNIIYCKKRLPKLGEKSL